LYAVDGEKVRDVLRGKGGGAVCCGFSVAQARLVWRLDIRAEGCDWFSVAMDVSRRCG
jgi:hypothetical protein